MEDSIPNSLLISLIHIVIVIPSHERLLSGGTLVLNTLLHGLFEQKLPLLVRQRRTSLNLLLSEGFNFAGFGGDALDGRLVDPVVGRVAFGGNFYDAGVVFGR